MPGTVEEQIFQIGGNIAIGVAMGFLLPQITPYLRGLIRVEIVTVAFASLVELIQHSFIAGISLTVDGAPIPRLSGADPMPEAIRAGQMLFNTADSDLYPVTTNHWVACASCHVEGRSDAVTWKFLEGPRDTPSNAGGKSDTGCEFRTADRAVVSDYWQTFEREQGGSFLGRLRRPQRDGQIEPLNELQESHIHTFNCVKHASS